LEDIYKKKKKSPSTKYLFFSLSRNKKLKI
jgi:hypothetical protein